MFGTHQAIAGFLGKQIEELEDENENLKARLERLQAQYDELKRSHDDLKLVVRSWKDVAES